MHHKEEEEEEGCGTGRAVCNSGGSRDIGGWGTYAPMFGPHLGGASRIAVGESAAPPVYSDAERDGRV